MCLLAASQGVSGSCLRNLKPIVRTQWIVLPISQVLVSFINKLREADEKDKHIGQDPVVTRGDPDVEEFIVDGDGDEQLGMPEDKEATDRTPARVREMPDDLVD